MRVSNPVYTAEGGRPAAGGCESVGKAEAPAHGRSGTCPTLPGLRYTGRFMSRLLEGKLALVTGIANRWSLAYAIAQAFAREGATLVLTYLGERQKVSIDELEPDLNVALIHPCDVTKDEELAGLTSALAALKRPLHAAVHSLAFANRDRKSTRLNSS